MREKAIRIFPEHVDDTGLMEGGIMASAKRFCDQCGEAIMSNASRYCSSCGAVFPQLGPGIEPPPPTPATTPASVSTESPASSQPGPGEDETIKNPLTYVGGVAILIGWIWAVVIFFQHSDSWLWLAGFGWMLAVLLDPVYALYEAFWWREWIPALILIPAFGLGIGGATVREHSEVK